MQQIILLRGGTAKENYRCYYDFLKKYRINPYEKKHLKWSDTLSNDLGESFEVLEVKRPNKHFADYKARKIMFEKYIPYIRNGAVFVGHSLGGTFFLKYFDENSKLLEKFKKAVLVAPAVKDSENEVLGSFKSDLNFKNLKNFQYKIVVFASKDDFVVKFRDILILQKALPNVNYKIFENKGHFSQEKFNELYKELGKN